MASRFVDEKSVVQREEMTCSGSPHEGGRERDPHLYILTLYSPLTLFLVKALVTEQQALPGWGDRAALLAYHH